MTVDIMNFCLNTPFKCFEYMKLKHSELSRDVIAQYRLENKATPEGGMYVEIHKRIYGSPQGDLFAQEMLEKCLHEKWY